MNIFKLVATGVMLCIVSSFAAAQQFELKPYGFIKGDAVYATDGVTSFGNPTLVAPQIAGGADTSALGFTAQHSRLGLKGSIGDAEFHAGGLVEIDFLVTSFIANSNPRMRLAYAWMGTGGFEARFGQQWDIFSPMNATTLNTNGNLWYGGNLGFRRAMLQFMYTAQMEGLTPTLQLALCEATSDGAATLGMDNFSLMPMIQGRLAIKFMKNYSVGGAFVMATHRPDQSADSLDFSTTGFGADFFLPFDPLLTLKGEVNLGTNLANATMFSIAGKGAKDVDKKNMAVWVNATSKIDPKLILTLGFGMDQNQTDDEYINLGDIESNTVIYGGVQVPFNHGFSLGLEVESITTKQVTAIEDGVPESSDRTALVVILSGWIAF